MKHILFISMVAVAALFVCGTAGAQIFGSPSATLEQGQLGLNIIGGYEERSISFESVAMLRKVDFSNRLGEANIAYGLFDWLELYLKTGIAYPRVTESSPFWGEDFVMDSISPDIGAGARLTMYTSEDGRLKVGWMNQIRFCWIKDNWTREAQIGDDIFLFMHNDEKWRIAQFDTLIGPSYEGDGWSVYGGVLGSFVGGTRRTENLVLILPMGGGTTIKDIQELHDDAVGGVLGGTINLAEGIDITMEGSGMSDGWSISGGVKFTF